MLETTIAFSPAFAALPYAILIQMQMIGWLNQTFNCTNFKIVKNDAQVYLFLANEGKQTCGNYNYGEYLGCAYFTKPFKIVLNEDLFGFNKTRDFAFKYRRNTLIHEFEHYYAQNLVHSGLEMNNYRKNNCNS